VRRKDRPDIDLEAHSNRVRQTKLGAATGLQGECGPRLGRAVVLRSHRERRADQSRVRNWILQWLCGTSDGAVVPERPGPEVIRWFLFLWNPVTSDLVHGQS
jgi:hypothetical protein